MIRIHPNRAFTCLLLLSLIVRIAVLVGTPDALSVDTDSYRELAENVLHHGTFGHADVPTAYRPPLYPILLTGCVAFEDNSRPFMGLLHLLLGMTTVGLVFLLGRRWGLEHYTFLAAGLVAVDPILLRQSTLIMTETLATFLATLGLFVLTRLGERPCSTFAAMAGVCLGLAALCRPTFLVWAVGVLIMLPWIDCSWKGRSHLIGSYLVALLLVLSPWTIRNHMQFGRPIVATTHGGYTLLLGNNSSFYEYLRIGSWGSIWNAQSFHQEWALQTRAKQEDRLQTRPGSTSREKGRREVPVPPFRGEHNDPADELRLDRLAYQQAMQNARLEPGSFVLACLVRVGRLWTPLSHRTSRSESTLAMRLRYAVGIWYLIELSLAIVGIGYAWRMSTVWVKTWWWGVLLAISFTAIHALYWSNMRMRAPLMPVVSLAAAAGFARLTKLRIPCTHGCGPVA